MAGVTPAEKRPAATEPGAHSSAHSPARAGHYAERKQIHIQKNKYGGTGQVANFRVKKSNNLKRILIYPFLPLPICAGPVNKIATY